MAAGIRWRRAIVIALLLHCVMLTCIGWLAFRALAVPDIPEQIVELDLANGPEDPYETAGSMDSGSAPAMTVPVSAAVNNNRPVIASPATIADVAEAVRETVPSAQAVTGSMSVLEAGTDDNSSGSGAAGGQDGGGTGAGGAGTGTGPGVGSGSGSGSGKAGRGGGISSPGILSRVDPVYPEQAKRAGREGTVVLRIQIMENGRPGQVSVYRSSGWDLLDDAAVAAVEQWRFIPAKERDSGRAIVCSTTMPVVFRLKS